MADEILSQAEIEALIAGVGGGAQTDQPAAAAEPEKPAKKKGKAQAAPEADVPAITEPAADMPADDGGVPFVSEPASDGADQIPIGAVNTAVEPPAQPQMQQQPVQAPQQPQITMKSPHPDASVRPMQFAPLSNHPDSGFKSSVDLIMDVQLHVAVELGRTTMQVRDVLSLGPGSVVELDKHSGEPVEVVVNNKIVARGEVVVIDENFGVRITEIVNSKGRDVDLQAA